MYRVHSSCQGPGNQGPWRAVVQRSPLLLSRQVRCQNMPLDSGHIPCKAEGTACHIATVPAGAGGLVLGVGAGASARWWCCGGAGAGATAAERTTCPTVVLYHYCEDKPYKYNVLAAVPVAASRALLPSSRQLWLRPPTTHFLLPRAFHIDTQPSWTAAPPAASLILCNADTGQGRTDRRGEARTAGGRCTGQSYNGHHRKPRPARDHGPEDRTNRLSASHGGGSSRTSSHVDGIS